jgi:phosphopantothenoylcysteine decarboxylase/phosphopantothenate--cysteine ligase
VLVTAGPTCEDIDPVRFITNRASGAMGVALAGAALDMGAAVTLVHGPLRVPLPSHDDLTVCAVRSAADMHAAVMGHLAGVDVAIMAAAVADFTPAETAPAKIKKTGQDGLTLTLVRTHDILAELGRLPKRPFLVGFAAESEDVFASAARKLRSKGCDLICANDITEPGSGFSCETNRVIVIRRDGSTVDIPRLPKREVADRILSLVADAVSGKGSDGRCA